MRLIALLCTLSCAGAALAQEDQFLHQRTPARSAAVERPVGRQQDTARVPVGTVTIVESSRIQGYMVDYTAKKRALKGYRVQIFLGDRSQAEAVRRSFLQQHPDIPAYLSYLAPNFRVRVGDLRDRMEAEFLKDKLRPAFPGSYLVPDDIQPPKLKTIAESGTAP